MVTDITTIDKGVIMHQVNCQNIMGAGVAKALYTKYPQVKEKFHQLATQPDYNTPEKRYCLVQPVKINSQLIILNSFSQFHLKSNQDAMTSISHGGMIRISFKNKRFPTPFY